MASQQNKYHNMQEPIKEKRHQNGFFPEHPWRAPKFVLHLDGFLPEHNLFHGGEHLYGISSEHFLFLSFFGARMTLGQT